MYPLIKKCKFCSAPMLITYDRVHPDNRKTCSDRCRQALKRKRDKAGRNYTKVKQLRERARVKFKN